MKDKGLFKKYEVTKISNPSKEVDAIVLEFDDAISRVALRKYSSILRNAGYNQLADDIIVKCNKYDTEQNITSYENTTAPVEYDDEPTEQLTTREINKLLDFVSRITGECDWEYQDDDYREFVEKIERKLERMRVAKQ